MEKSRWLVTKVETVIVEAKTEEHALFLGEQLLDFYGGDTLDLQVEELDPFAEDGDPED